MHILLSLLFLILLDSSFADENIQKSLESRGFKCNSVILDGCQYSECRGRIPSYPLEVMISVPSEVTGLRVHFHGHILNKFPQYERDLSEMVKSFNLNKSLCVSKKMHVFPKSEGNCKTYDLHLKNNESLVSFYTDIEEVSGRTFSNISLSAHSGGGRVLARFLKSGLSISEVSIFDGIYSDKERILIEEWFLNTGGVLNLSTVQGMTPELMVKKIVKKISPEEEMTKTLIEKVSYEMLETPRFYFLNRLKNNEDLLTAHYKVLSETWPIFK